MGRPTTWDACERVRGSPNRNPLVRNWARQSNRVLNREVERDRFKSRQSTSRDSFYLKPVNRVRGVLTRAMVLSAVGTAPP